MTGPVSRLDARPRSKHGSRRCSGWRRSFRVPPSSWSVRWTPVGSEPTWTLRFPPHLLAVHVRIADLSTMLVGWAIPRWLTRSGKATAHPPGRSQRAERCGRTAETVTHYCGTSIRFARPGKRPIPIRTRRSPPAQWAAPLRTSAEKMAAYCRCGARRARRAGEGRQPPGRRALEPELDPSPRRSLPLGVDVSLRDDGDDIVFAQ